MAEERSGRQHQAMRPGLHAQTALGQYRSPRIPADLLGAGRRWRHLLTGHEHNYQAQPKRAANGAESSTGVAQYVVGTGGRSVWRNASVADQKPIAFNSTTFGWLKLTLHSTSADLKFVPVGAH